MSPKHDVCPDELAAELLLSCRCQLRVPTAAVRTCTRSSSVNQGPLAAAVARFLPPPPPLPLAGAAFFALASAATTLPAASSPALRFAPAGS